MEGSVFPTVSQIIDNDSEEQESRVFLRERFLKLFANILTKRDCECKMFENVTVNGKLCAFDANFQNIAIEDLQTPCLSPENAILRTRDIISIHLNNIPLESFNK